MPDHDRPLDTKQPERLGQDGALRRCGPMPSPRPITVAKAGPVECYGAIPARDLADHPADQHILHHRPVAVEENDGRPASLLDIVEPRPARSDEAAQRRIPPLGLSCMPVHDDSGARQGNAGDADQTADCRRTPTPLRCRQLAES